MTQAKADGLLSWVLSHALRRPTELVAAVTLTGVRVAVGVAKPWPMAFLIDRVLTPTGGTTWISQVVGRLPLPDDRLALLNWAVAATLVLFLLDWATELALKYVSVSLGQKMTYDVATDLLRHLQRLSLSFHGARSTGDIIRRLTTDSGAVATVVRDAFLPLLASGATLAAMFLIMWRLDPVLTLTAAAVVPVMLVILRFYAGPMLARSYGEQNAEGRLYDVAEVTFSSIPAVQAFGREGLNETLFRSAAADSVRASLAALNINLQFKILIGLSSAVGAATILWLGAEATLAGRTTVGVIVLFLSYLTLLYEPLNGLMYTGPAVQGAAGSAKRVFEILSTEPEVRDRPGALALGTAGGRIVFDQVGFSYGREEPALRGVSLEIEPGETVALAGPTGAGKTTLASLIPRFFDPTAGRVLLDGRDLRDLRLASLRAQVALVLQEPLLFPLSVAENIAYGRPGASMNQIEAAARAANAHDFIARLPDGYQTVLGERGATLSGGERQRLSIARAILRDAPLLILDEPTSALDAGSEALILQALQRLTKGRTTLIIAHRLATIRNADRIVVLDHGRIAETGSHETLAAAGGLYASYLALQALPG